MTQEERALVAKHPKKMVDAYLLTWTAENLCLSIFEENDINDESDACRHFVWAALLYKKFGIYLSRKILNAHERAPKQPKKEAAMDLTNNQLGLAAAAKLSEENKLGKKEILRAFQKSLKEGKLVILKPGARRKASRSVLEGMRGKLKSHKEQKILKGRDKQRAK